MALTLYLDDCANSTLLAERLIQAGHTVIRPAEAGTAWKDDPVHLEYARQHGLIVVTKDPDDFKGLHALDANHPGIFGIYQDNDPGRDMTVGEIEAAIGRIEQAIPLGYPIPGNFHVLNDWR